LDERIATGGMGDVWRGTDVVLGRVIAVKVLKPAMLIDPEFAARFYGEARMMAAFRHPGVVEVYDYASADDSADEDQCAYLVMAFVDGEPLSTRLKEAGTLGVSETMSYVAQAAEALHAAHENGTIHRDVKPGNLIVKPNGAVILVDFGVARSAAVTSVTGLNAIVGTALYMAPEQVAKGNVTPATDIYALGAVAYHCIAGHPPFDGDNALQVALRHLEDEPEPLPEHVPAPVRELISRAMAKAPEDRFASAADFAAAALATGGALDWQNLSGSAMTGTALTAPLSAPLSSTSTRTVTAPRGLPPTPSTPFHSASPAGRPRSQLVVLLAIVGLLVVAGGLAIAIALSGDNKNGTGTGTTPPPDDATTSAEPNVPLVPGPSQSPTRSTNRPNGQNGKPSLSPTPRRSPTPSAPPKTTPPVPTTTPPVIPTTTTAPVTEEPTQPTEPETPANGGGGDAGGDAGVG
jgi:serine/threonine-protein kinase